MPAPQSLSSIRNDIGAAGKVCLFGVGALLQDCFHQIVLFLGRTPDFLCDNSREKWGGEFFGIKCISPSELAETRNETAVLITVKNYEKIFMQLRDLEMKDVYVCCFDRSYNGLSAVKRLESEHPATQAPSRRMIPVKGKWTLVTGASRGVGRQIAVEMARLGSNIVAHSRSVANVRELVDFTLAPGVEIVPVEAELGDPGQVDAMLSGLERLVPQIDIVFNNAAIACEEGGFWSSSAQDYLNCYTVNALAPIRICRALLPAMMKRGFGRIVNITSSVQKRPETMAYACSKAALDKFVHDLAPSLAGTGVMLSLADPGWLRTDMTHFIGPHAVESVIPGALLGAVIDGNVNGRWFGIQDYAGMSLEDAVAKANAVFASPMDVPTIHVARWAAEIR